jgi:uncharacterized protein YggE
MHRALANFKILLLSMLALLARPALAEDSVLIRPAERTITITATGMVEVIPDEVTVTLGVRTEAQTAKAALEANSAAMRPIIDTLKGAGIEDKDIQTSNFSIQPSYDYSQNGKPPKLVGHTVSNLVHVKLHDTKRLGVVLDKVVALGSNEVSTIEFSSSKAEGMRDEARKKAVENAKRMADIYTKAAGVELGQVLSISEGEVEQGPRPMPMRAAVAKASPGGPPPIEAGEQSLQAQVTIVWAIK